MASILPDLTCGCNAARCQFCLRCSKCCGCGNDDELDGVAVPTKGSGRKRKNSVSSKSAKKRKKVGKSSKKKKKRRKVKGSSPNKTKKRSKSRDEESSEEEEEEEEDVEDDEVSENESAHESTTCIKDEKKLDDNEAIESDNDDTKTSENDGQDDLEPNEAKSTPRKSKSKKTKKRSRSSVVMKSHPKSNSLAPTDSPGFTVLSDSHATPKDIEHAFGWYEGKVTKKIPRLELRTFYSKRSEICDGTWKSTLNVLDNTTKVLAKIIYPANPTELMTAFNSRKGSRAGRDTESTKDGLEDDSDVSNGEDSDNDSPSISKNVSQGEVVQASVDSATVDKLTKRLKKAEQRVKKLRKKANLYRDRCAENNAFVSSVLECTRAVPHGSPEERVCHALICGTYSRSKLNAICKSLGHKVSISERIREDAKRDMETLLKGNSLFQEGGSSSTALVGSVRKGDSSKIRAAVTYLTSPAVVGYHAYGQKSIVVKGKREELLGLAMCVTQEKLFQRYKVWCDSLSHGIISRKELLNVLGALISKDSTEIAEERDSIFGFLIDDTFEVLLQQCKEKVLQQDGMELHGPVDPEIAASEAPALAPDQLRVVLIVRRAYFFLKFHYHNHVLGAMTNQTSSTSNGVNVNKQDVCHNTMYGLGLDAEECDENVNCKGCSLVPCAMHMMRQLVGVTNPTIAKMLERCESAINLFMAHRVRAAHQKVICDTYHEQVLDVKSTEAVQPANQGESIPLNYPINDVEDVWVVLNLTPIVKTSQFLWECAKVYATSKATGPVTTFFDDIVPNCLPHVDPSNPTEGDLKSHLCLFTSHVESLLLRLLKMYPNLKRIQFESNSHVHSDLTPGEIVSMLTRLCQEHNIPAFQWIQHEPMSPFKSELEDHIVNVSKAVDMHLLSGKSFKTLNATQLTAFLAAHFGFYHVNGLDQKETESKRGNDVVCDVKQEDDANNKAVKSESTNNKAVKSESTKTPTMEVETTNGSKEESTATANGIPNANRETSNNLTDADQSNKQSIREETFTTYMQYDLQRCNDCVLKVISLLESSMFWSSPELRGATHTRVYINDGSKVRLECAPYAILDPSSFEWITFEVNFDDGSSTRGEQSDGDTVCVRDGKVIGSLQVYDDMIKHQALVTAVPYFGPALHKSAPLPSDGTEQKIKPPSLKEELCTAIGSITGVRLRSTEASGASLDDDFVKTVNATKKKAQTDGTVAHDVTLVAGAIPGIEGATDSAVVSQAMEHALEMQRSGEIKLNLVDIESEDDYKDVPEVPTKITNMPKGWARRHHWVKVRELENQSSVKHYRASLRIVLNKLKHARKRVPVDVVWKSLASRHPGAGELPTKTQVEREIIRVRAIRGDEDVKILARADGASAGGDGREEGLEAGDDDGNGKPNAKQDKKSGVKRPRGKATKKKAAVVAPTVSSDDDEDGQGSQSSEASENDDESEVDEEDEGNSDSESDNTDDDDELSEEDTSARSDDGTEQGDKKDASPMISKKANKSDSSSSAMNSSSNGSSPPPKTQQQSRKAEQNDDDQKSDQDSNNATTKSVPVSASPVPVNSATSSSPQGPSAAQVPGYVQQQPNQHQMSQMYQQYQQHLMHNPSFQAHQSGYQVSGFPAGVQWAAAPGLPQQLQGWALQQQQAQQQAQQQQQMLQQYHHASALQQLQQQQQQQQRPQ